MKGERRPGLGLYVVVLVMFMRQSAMSRMLLTFVLFEYFFLIDVTFVTSRLLTQVLNFVTYKWKLIFKLTQSLKTCDLDHSSNY